MDMCIHAACGDDHAFTSDDLGGATDGHRHIGLNIRIASLADAGDATFLDADIGFDNAPVIKNHRIGDHGIHHFPMCSLRLTHAVANHLSTAEFHFLAVGRVIFFDLDEELSVGQTDAISCRRTKHFCVGLARYLAHQMASFSLPITFALNPYTLRSPARATSSTVRSWPGSKRTAVPAAILSRIP